VNILSIKFIIQLCNHSNWQNVQNKITMAMIKKRS